MTLGATAAIAGGLLPFLPGALVKSALATAVTAAARPAKRAA